MSFPKMLHSCRKKHVDLRDIDCYQHVNRPYIINRSTLESYLSNIYYHLYPRNHQSISILTSENWLSWGPKIQVRPPPPLEGPMILRDAPLQNLRRKIWRFLKEMAPKDTKQRFLNLCLGNWTDFDSWLSIYPDIQTPIEEVFEPINISWARLLGVPNTYYLEDFGWLDIYQVPQSDLVGTHRWSVF